MAKSSISEEKWRSLKIRLRRSKVRAAFTLGESERAYIHDRTLSLVESHARDFVMQRLAPAQPRNEGKQTPMKGHPVFLAQHATATCCRACLEKVHGIKAGKVLTARQVDFVQEVIMRWLTDEMASETPPVPEDS